MFEELTLHLGHAQRQELLARVAALPEDQAAQLVVALREEVLKRCAKDGLFWLRFVKTRDESDPDNTLKPFPRDLEYVQLLWHILSTRNKVVIAKSRQMMASWVAATFCVWWAMFKPNQYVCFQTQKEDDAIKMVCTAGGDKDTGYAGRMQFILRSLPAWMRPSVRESEGSLQFPNGSMIEALAGGANKVRGKVFSLYIGDEFAFQDEAKSVYTSIAPLMQKGAKVVLISTPNGSDSNVFYHLFSGIPMAKD